MHYTSTPHTLRTWQIVTELAEGPTGRQNQINDMNFLFKDINARSASWANVLRWDPISVANLGAKSGWVLCFQRSVLYEYETYRFNRHRILKLEII